MPIVVGGIAAPVPYAPTLLTPANASVVDLAGEPTAGYVVGWTYNPGAPLVVQSGYLLRVKVAGAASYVYWNASISAWQSGSVVNAATVSNVALPPGAFQNGVVYNVSVATVDVNGTGPFCPDVTATALTAPTVVVTAPGGTVVTALPVVSWAPGMASPSIPVPVRANSTAYTLGMEVQPVTANGRVYRCVTAGTSAASYTSFTTTVGNTVVDGTVTWECDTPFAVSTSSVTPVQTSYRAVIFSAAQYSIAGFNSATSPSTFDTGQQPGSLITQVACTTYLQPGITYRAYVQITETGGAFSTWAYSAFTTNFSAPVTPLFSAAAGSDSVSGAPLMMLTVRGGDNHLPVKATAPVVGSIGWTAGANSTIGTPTTYAGVIGFPVTATAAGTVSISTPVAGLPVLGGTTYQVFTRWFAPGTVTCVVNWRNVAGALVGSPVTAYSGAGGTGSWTVTAPAGAVSADIVTTAAGLGAGAAASFFAGVAKFAPGTASIPSATLLPSGLVGNTKVNLTYSDNLGNNWYPVRGGTGVVLPAAGQQVRVADQELPPGYKRQYQVQIVANLTSPVASLATAGAGITGDQLVWWLKDVITGDSMKLSLAPGVLGTNSTDRQQVVEVLTRPDPVVLSDAFTLPELKFSLVFIGDAAYQQFENMRATQHVLLFQGPYPAGQWYVRLGKAKGDETNLPSLRYLDSTKVVRNVTMTAQAVAAP